jgi:dCMP deaminase
MTAAGSSDRSAGQTDLAVIAYIPVLHRGYLRFIDTHAAQAQHLYILGPEVLAEFDHLRKDVRSLPPAEVATALEAVRPDLTSKITVLTPNMLDTLRSSRVTIVMPDEDIMRELAARYFLDQDIQYDSVFLRWDSSRSLKHLEVEADQVMEVTEFDQQMAELAQTLAQKSADWWRQVGAVIVKDGQIIAQAHNHHVPLEQQPYFDGDPRGNFHKGQHIDLSTAIHAEAEAVAQAAQAGQSLAGASIYVTTFPCPYCAKLLAYTGIEAVYFSEGYAMVDGESILKTQGIKIIKVELTPHS